MVTSDGVGALDVGVVGAHGEGGAGGGALADRDRDRLAVAQRDDERRAGDGVVQRGGVDDAAAFGDLAADALSVTRGGVAVVGDGGADGGGRGDRLEVAARGAADADIRRPGRPGRRRRRRARRRPRCWPLAVADRDGDGLAVAQRDDKRRAGDGVVQRRGVDDAAAFGDAGGRGAQGDSGGIRIVGDGGGGGGGGGRRLRSCRRRCALMPTSTAGRPGRRRRRRAR